jgi:hypothetical protein
MGVSLFDRKGFASPASGVRSVAVERCTTIQIVKENRKKGGEILEGVERFPTNPFPFIIPKTEVL